MAKKPSEPAQKVKMKLVPAEVARAIAKGGAGIDSAQLVNALIRRWGGADRFVADIFTEYQNAKLGSLARQRFLEMATRLIVQVTSQEIGKPKAVSDMTDVEIMENLRHLLEKVNGPGNPAPKAE